MVSFVTPLVGSAGLRRLLQLLIRVVIWRLIFHTVGGFLARYTHLPPVVNVIILVLLVVVVRFVVLHLRRRRS